jgi:hypothetical protein
MFRSVLRRSLVGAALASLALLAPFFAGETAPAAPLVTAKLEDGLAYVRADDLGQPTVRDAIERALAGPAAVLDLRYAHGDADDAAWLRAQLSRARDQLRRTVYLLANDQTSPRLVPAFADLPAAARTVVIAPAQSAVPAQVQVAVTPEHDRVAYAAGREAAALPGLIAEVVEKRRFDEAALVSRRANNRPAASPAAPLPPDPSGINGPPRTTSAEEASDNVELAPPPLRDVLLQRAVFLHRGLVALQLAASA